MPKQKWKCKSCGATYDDTTHDGYTYYHSCPPDTPERRDENIDGKTRKGKSEGKGRDKL